VLRVGDPMSQNRQSQASYQRDGRTDGQTDSFIYRCTYLMITHMFDDYHIHILQQNIMH